MPRSSATERKIKGERRMASLCRGFLPQFSIEVKKRKPFSTLHSHKADDRNCAFRQTLPNGLILEFYDRSRPMAGDRWQVILEVRLPIPVTAATLPPDLRDRAEEVITALGQEIFFTKQEMRHFIDAREVPAMLQEIQTRLWEGLKDYMGHPEFCRALYP
jgi:hypothetical protein